MVIGYNQNHGKPEWKQTVEAVNMPETPLVLL
jgi:hypothetical protein